jgi:hypothetical protein
MLLDSVKISAPVETMPAVMIAATACLSLREFTKKKHRDTHPKYSALIMLPICVWFAPSETDMLFD